MWLFFLVFDATTFDETHATSLSGILALSQYSENSVYLLRRNVSAGLLVWSSLNSKGIFSEYLMMPRYMSQKFGPTLASWHCMYNLNYFSQCFVLLYYSAGAMSVPLARQRSLQFGTPSTFWCTASTPENSGHTTTERKRPSGQP